MLSLESGASAWTETRDGGQECGGERGQDSGPQPPLGGDRQAQTGEGGAGGEQQQVGAGGDPGGPADPPDPGGDHLGFLLQEELLSARSGPAQCGGGSEEDLPGPAPVIQQGESRPVSVDSHLNTVLQADLRSLGISVNDYLNPPPAYLDLFTDSLQYLDLEQGHNRLAKLSFCNEDGSVARLARLSVASCENCSTESPVVVPVRPDRASQSSVASSVSTRSSRSSRVSFSEEVECSNGSIRRLSTNSLIGLKEASSKTSLSSNNESRKSSLKSNLKRKLGSTTDDGFISNLDDDLKEKLESPSSASEDVSRRAESEAKTKAETQAERAARICDIIVEEK